MNEIIQLIRSFFQSFQPWITVAPWEQALRVRLGKRVKLLGAGVWLKIPFVDGVYLQSVRLRVSSFGRQTNTTSDGKTLTTSGCVGYTIVSIRDLYDTLQHPEDVINNLSAKAVSSYISGHTLQELSPNSMSANISGTLGLWKYGLGSVEIIITEFVVVRTYRLIGDFTGGMYGERLSTDSESRGSA